MTFWVCSRLKVCLLYFNCQRKVYYRRVHACTLSFPLDSVWEAEESRVYVRWYEGQERLSLRMTMFIVKRDKDHSKNFLFWVIQGIWISNGKFGLKGGKYYFILPSPNCRVFCLFVCLVTELRRGIQAASCVGPGKSRLPFELRRKAGQGLNSQLLLHLLHFR